MHWLRRKPVVWLRKRPRERPQKKRPRRKPREKPLNRQKEKQKRQLIRKPQRNWPLKEETLLDRMMNE